MQKELVKNLFIGLLIWLQARVDSVMKSHTYKKTSAILNSVLVILTMIMLTNTIKAGEVICQPLEEKVCRIMSITNGGTDKSRITFKTLNDDDTWSLNKEAMIPHKDHFVGEIFVGGHAPKGWIIFDRYSKASSTIYISYIEKIRKANGARKIALQRSLFDSIDKQEAREGKRCHAAIR